MHTDVVFRKRADCRHYLPVILLTGNSVPDALKDDQYRRHEGRNLVFRAADIALKEEKTDFRN